MKITICLIIASFLFWSDAIAQIPIEVFAGDKKTSFDLLFFKYFKNSQNVNSKLLFFNRNRVNIDYKQTSTTNLPIFGFTEAISYNHSKLKGLAPVLVVQMNNSGVFPKLGIQYFHRKNNFTFFSWLVTETLKQPFIDFFVLTRFEPKLTSKFNLFSQLELVNAIPTNNVLNYNLFQRIRVGLKMKQWQFGAGADFSETVNSAFMPTNNIGIFLRHEF